MSDALDAELEFECQVIRVLSDYFPLNSRKIEVGLRLAEDLYVDSISLVEIVMALNEAFGIDLSEAEVESWRSVADICCSVECSQ